MPKLITTFQLIRVFDDDEEVFAPTAILPNKPHRFALVEKVGGEKSKLLALAPADTVLHYLSILTMTIGHEARIESSSRCFTSSEFKVFADANLDSSETTEQ